MAVITGYASIFEQPYEMHDTFGPYQEVVDPGAFDASLNSGPDVVLRMNHTGSPLASTYAGSLEVWADDTGLGFRAEVDDARSDVADLVIGIRNGDIRETSMAGRIRRGKWSPDYEEYRLLEFSLDRGDVGPVTFGANPAGHVALDAAADTEHERDVILLSAALAVA
ncbi:MAG: HK97 family phage prohead protease [Chloroflexota bacterium]|nr:HK97 family phage prohead protease [Chloroflexota bacterium]